MNVSHYRRVQSLVIPLTPTYRADFPIHVASLPSPLLFFFVYFGCYTYIRKIQSNPTAINTRTCVFSFLSLPHDTIEYRHRPSECKCTVRLYIHRYMYSILIYCYSISWICARYVYKTQRGDDEKERKHTHHKKETFSNMAMSRLTEKILYAEWKHWFANENRIHDFGCCVSIENWLQKTLQAKKLFLVRHSHLIWFVQCGACDNTCDCEFIHQFCAWMHFIYCKNIDSWAASV